MDVCVLQDEIIVYGEGETKSEPRIQSYDIRDSTRRYNLDLTKFGITDI
jgi:hypothetical protein